MSKNTGRDNRDHKKKKLAPPSENAVAKKEYLELDEEELEHRRELELKYRDRAKERREGLLGASEELENMDEDNLVVSGSDEEEYFTTTKGLDYELLRKQQEKELNELGDGAKKERESMDLDELKKKDTKQLCKTAMGANIHRVLFKSGATKESRRNIFKSSNCYEFDVDFNFGSTLPKLVIRTRETKEEGERALSAHVGENVFGKISKIMTYIKTGKKVEHKKESNQDNKSQKTKEPVINPISTQNMSDSDEDDIFPGARKQVKQDVPAKPAATASTEETKKENGEEHTVKGIFNQIKTAKQNIEVMEVEEESDALGSKQIAERNKQFLAELAKKRAEEKLNQLQHKDDGYYMECFPEDAPELEDLKNQQKMLQQQNKKSAKAKKKELTKQVGQVTKIMEEKRKGGGGGGGSRDDD